MAVKKYEEMIKDVESLLQDMNNKELPLEEAVNKYKAGMKLIDSCEKTLEKVEKDLKIIED